MKEKIIKSFSDLHEIVQGYGKKTVIYRGVKKLSHELLPHVGRYDFSKSDIQKEERTMLRLFKEQAIPHLPFWPSNEWEWLAISQEHGLPTRLLDWTRNPLIAAYFAVAKKHGGDSAIYAFHSSTFIDIGKHPNPFEIGKVQKFIPAHTSPRITAQVGVFTIHPDPTVPFDSSNVERLIIKRESRKDLKWILYRYGIHRASLFPDLDGLASHVKWLRTDVY
jgi:hypothetical protein